MTTKTSCPERLIDDISEKAREIHTDAYPMSIGELMSLYRDEEIDIHPEFQRFFRWSELQKSKFIESILLGIPIPSIFVAQRADGVWDVVDGVQRLSTIFQFTGILRDGAGQTYRPLTLTGTDYLPDLKGMVWQDEAHPDNSFVNSLRLDFKRAKLDLKIIKKESDENTKYDLFMRLNSLGSRLSDQELRNCLLVMINPGLFRWLEELSSFDAFREAIALTDKAYEERYDMELVLRFLLLSRAEVKDLQGVKDVDEFITKGMRDLAADPSFDMNSEAELFRKTFTAVLDALGGNCFSRPGGGQGRGGFLISVFEVLAAGLGWRIRSKPNAAIGRAKLKAAYVSLERNGRFREYSKSGRSASSRMPQLVPLGRELFDSV
jgi:hypothetical protein